MSELIALFGRAFLIGIAVAAPVGAMGVLCIQRTLAGGWRRGVATGAGIATADGFYASLAAFGIGNISKAVVEFQDPLRLVGGVALVLMGVAAVLRRPPGEARIDAEDGGLVAAYASAVGLTLTNPMTVMAFAAVFASVGLVALHGVAAEAIATAGVVLGSLAWWLVLTTVVSQVRHALSPRTLRGVGIASGLLLAVFGVFTIASAL